MVKLFDDGVYLVNGKEIITEKESAKFPDMGWNAASKKNAKKGTIAYSILEAHNVSDNMEELHIKFDAMASHDITFVGIVQTAKASGMEKFPIPYVLTNCHNSLCAVGGTINEDDHMFGLSAAKKYGGIYVPTHMAVIHQYMREMMAGCGKMILGSDSHTRYGALGTMAIGEGGGELVKQLLNATYDISYPDVVAVYLDKAPNPGVGPQDIALAIIGSVFKNGYVKNKVMEFVGPGISSMGTDFRNSIDVMTTETTCLSSIWQTDEDTKAYLTMHGRGSDYKELLPAHMAYYDGMVYVDLSTVKPMIALPFHPSNTYELDEFNANLEDILRQVEINAEKVMDNNKVHLALTDKIVNGKLKVDQAIIAGCAGGNYNNIMEAAHILEGKSCGNDAFSLSVYPSSQPVFMDMSNKGITGKLMASGAVIRAAFCGPCFGAGDTPVDGGLSIRHTTRNFPNREGSKPEKGQIASVALMDARSIAATAANGGYLTSAQHVAEGYQVPAYFFDKAVYDNRVYDGYMKEDLQAELKYGPNIKEWPQMSVLTDNILMKVCSLILDSVTTTDELIPSGETASYRSNPLGLAEFTLSRRDPSYVGRAKKVNISEKTRVAGKDPSVEAKELQDVFKMIRTIKGNEDVNPTETAIGSIIYAIRPGDGSAREQAASCQRVLGGIANIAKEYATKRYRSNLINWGMIPFQLKAEPEFELGSYIYIPRIRTILDGDMTSISAYIIGDEVKEIELFISDLTNDEREIIKAGSLINYNKFHKK